MKLNNKTFIKEAVNPENIEINKKIKDVITGKSRAFNNLKKMGYEVEVDDEAQKMFGKKYFGKNITIKNPKTERSIYGNFGQQWTTDTISARPYGPKSNNQKAYHALSSDHRNIKITGDKDKFDYKNYLDTPITEVPREEDKLSTVQRFRKDKQFLKDNEYQIDRIDSARERIANVRSKYNLKAEALANVSKDDVGTTEKPVYAAAVRDLKAADKTREENTKIQDAPKHDEKPKNPKMANGAKKMKLESYDEEFDEEDFEDAEEGVCPECGYPLEYTSSPIVVDSETAYYDCECPECKKHFKEWHDIQLIFSHFEDNNSELEKLQLHEDFSMYDDEDNVTYSVVTINSNYIPSVETYSIDSEADAAIEELKQMSDEELYNIDILGYAQLEQYEDGIYVRDYYISEKADYDQAREALNNVSSYDEDNLDESKDSKTLVETGEWEDDDEGLASKEYLLNLIKAYTDFDNITIEDIKGFDKYQGPYAYDSGLEFWIDQEWDNCLLIHDESYTNNPSAWYRICSKEDFENFKNNNLKPLEEKCSSKNN